MSKEQALLSFVEKVVTSSDSVRPSWVSMCVLGWYQDENDKTVETCSFALPKDGDLATDRVSLLKNAAMRLHDIAANIDARADRLSKENAHG